MQTLLLFILDLILAAIAYFLYIGVFIPTMQKNKVYDKIKAKERDALDQALGMQEYFGIRMDATDEKKRK